MWPGHNFAGSFVVWVAATFLMRAKQRKVYSPLTIWSWGVATMCESRTKCRQNHKLHTLISFPDDYVLKLVWTSAIDLKRRRLHLIPVQMRVQDAARRDAVVGGYHFHASWLVSTQFSSWFWCWTIPFFHILCTLAWDWLHSQAMVWISFIDWLPLHCRSPNDSMSSLFATFKKSPDISSQMRNLIMGRRGGEEPVKLHFIIWL